MKKLLKKVLLKWLEKNDKPTLIDTPTKIIDLEKKPKVLFLRQDRLGDVLVTTPIINIIQQKCPEAKFDFVFSYRNISCKAAFSDVINDFFVLPKGPLGQFLFFIKMRNKKYDYVVDLFDNPSSTSSILCKLIDADYNIGIDKKNRNSYDYIVPLLDKQKNHIVYRIAELLKVFEIEPSDKVFEISYPGVETKSNRSVKKLGIVLSGSSRSKYWGAENLISIINMLKSEYDFEILLFATKDYDDEKKQILNETSVTDPGYFDSFNKYAYALSDLDYLITPDTSAVHLASAYKINTIALYTAIKGDVGGIPWSPFNTPSKVISSTSGVLEDIKPDLVFKKFKELILELKG